MLYTIWRCCERWNIRPPGIKENYQDNTSWGMAQLIGYEVIRSLEDQPCL